MIKGFGISTIDMVFNGHTISNKISPVWTSTIEKEKSLDTFLLLAHKQVDRMGEVLRKEIASD